MRIIAAVDKFRGTATAAEVAAAIGSAGWELGHDVVEIPVADGGEGLLDVLGGLDELKICTAYEIDGTRTAQFPSHADDLKKAVPVYETLPGWEEDLSKIGRAHV